MRKRPRGKGKRKACYDAGMVRFRDELATLWPMQVMSCQHEARSVKTACANLHNLELSLCFPPASLLKRTTLCELVPGQSKGSLVLSCYSNSKGGRQLFASRPWLRGASCRTFPMRRERVGSMCTGMGDKFEHVGETRRAPRFLRRLLLWVCLSSHAVWCRRLRH